MNRIRVFAIGSVLMFALTTAAQQTTTSPDRSANAGLPSVEQQSKVLTEKLALTGDQQARMKPILQELHDTTLKLMADKSLTQEERLEKVRPLRYETRRKMREILNDEQKRKLDDYLQGPHSEMHGNLTGTPAEPGSHNF